MTFREYYKTLGLAAFFASARQAVDNWYSERDARIESDKLRETEKQGFLDRDLGRLNFKPIHMQPPVPLPLPAHKPAMSINSLMDEAAAEIEKAQNQQPREVRVEGLEERLRKIAPNGIPSNGNGVSA